MIEKEFISIQEFGNTYSVGYWDGDEFVALMEINLEFLLAPKIDSKVVAQHICHLWNNHARTVDMIMHRLKQNGYKIIRE